MFHFELSGESHKYIFICEKYCWVLTSEMQIFCIDAKALIESTIKMSLGTKQCLNLQICFCNRNYDQSLIFYLIFGKHSKINWWGWITKIIFFVTHLILYCPVLRCRGNAHPQLGPYVFKSSEHSANLIVTSLCGKH